MELSSGKRIWTNKSELRKAYRILTECDKTMFCIDLETTGTKPKTDYPVEITAQRFDISDLNGRRSYIAGPDMDIYVKPPIPMPKEAEAVHHISDSYLKDMPNEDAAFPRVNAFFGPVNDLVIMGYNVSFDLEFLRYMNLRITGFDDFIVPDTRIIDVLKMSRALIKREEVPEGMTLTNVSALFGLHDDKMHLSSTDVRMTYALFGKLMSLYIKDFKKDDLLEDKKPKAEPTWVSFQKSDYKKTHSQGYVSVGFHTEDGYSGHIHYDVSLNRWIDDSQDTAKVNGIGDPEGGMFIGTYNMYDFERKVESKIGMPVKKYRGK